MRTGVIAKTTEFPLQLIGSVAGVSTDRSGSDKDKANRAWHCFELGHMSVFEHVSVTWKISGISRACSHQLVRHRLASFCQLSQRYVVVNTDADWYVIPPSTRDDDRMLEEYASEMWRCAEYYKSLLDDGMKPEDARYVLPEATKTDIIVTMNLREFMSFYKARSDKAAQWEIRELAEDMMRSFYMLGGEWMEVVHMIEEKVNGEIDGQR